jgi:hypothetical protein
MVAIVVVGFAARSSIRSLLGALALLAMGGLAASATAIVGHPAIPNSVAGVRRRTHRHTRRRIRRGMRLTALPYGCHTTRLRAGTKYYWCGGIWYRPVYQGTTVVYVVEDIDPGADTEVEFEEAG